MNKTIITIAIMTFLLSSCGLFRKNIDKKEKLKASDTTVIQKENKKMIAFADSLAVKYPKYEYLQTKMKIAYKEGNTEQNIKGNMKIKKDSFIWISARAYGFEVARFLLTPDSVKFMNKMKSEYFVGDYSFIEKSLNVKLDYQTIQSLLVNELFVLPKSNKSEFADFNIFSDTANFILQKNIHPRNMPDSLFQEVIIDKNNLKIQKSTSADSRFDRNFIINYSDFKDLKNTKFPFLIDINIIQKTKNIALKLEYYKLKLDREFKPSFKIPTSYNRIKIKKK